MKTYRLCVSSPDGDVFNGEIVNLSLRGAEGDLAILAGHMSFITSVVPGECKIQLEDGTERLAHTDGGILTVAPDKATLLAGSFRFTDSEND